jgi:hypothetical protein
LAEKYGGIFNGISPFTLGGMPPRDRHAIVIFLDFEKGKKADGIIEELESGTGLAERDKDYLVQFVPTSQFVPRSQKPATSA